MSQIEQSFRLLLSKKPEIEKCYAEGLINRRALARYLVKQGVAKSNQVEATIAMLRRFQFKREKEQKHVLKGVRIRIKDNILILDFEKSKELLKDVQKLITAINYDRGDTFKVVVGTGHITVYIDGEKEKKVKELLGKYKVVHRHKNISEVSLLFSDEAIQVKGVFSLITKELTVNDVVITELLTSSSELLLYLKEEYVLKAYDILKRLKN